MISILSTGRKDAGHTTALSTLGIVIKQSFSTAQQAASLRIEADEVAAGVIE